MDRTPLHHPEEERLRIEAEHHSGCWLYIAPEGEPQEAIILPAFERLCKRRSDGCASC
jgi:hypothetical protein